MHFSCKNKLKIQKCCSPPLLNPFQRDQLLFPNKIPGTNHTVLKLESMLKAQCSVTLRFLSSPFWNPKMARIVDLLFLSRVFAMFGGVFGLYSLRKQLFVGALRHAIHQGVHNRLKTRISFGATTAFKWNFSVALKRVGLSPKSSCASKHILHHPRLL